MIKYFFSLYSKGQQELLTQNIKIFSVIHTSLTSRRNNVVAVVVCSDPGGGAGAEEQSGAGGPTAADQQLDHRSEPLDRLSSDTQQPDGAAKQHQHLPGQRSHV